MRIKTEIPLSAAFIKNTLGIEKNTGDENKFISALCTDSREAVGGELYIGLKGENHDGSLFIDDIKDKVLLSVGSLNSSADIKSDDPNTSLLVLARAYKNLLPLKKTIAITGSVGKSTTKNLLGSLLSLRFVTHSTYGNLNNEFGVPFTVFGAPKNTEILVIEAGMNHANELKRISECISVITKIGSAHIGNFGSLEKIADAKCEILSGMKKELAIFPADEELLRSRIKNYKTVSLSDRIADYSLTDSEKNNTLIFKSKDSDFTLPIHLPENAPFHIEACLALSLAVCREMNMTQSEMLSALQNINFTSYSKQICLRNLKIINDSYNSSPDAVIGALNHLKTICGNKSAVIGDMLELGDLSEELHFKIGYRAACSDIKNLYLVGEFSKFILEGALAGGFDKERIFINENAENPEITAAQILKYSSDEVILFKASRKIKLERIIDILKKALK